MKSLAKASPEIAGAVWHAQRHPSLRRVAHALTVSGFPTSHTTIARWKLRNWRPVKSEHPLEVARVRLDATAPLVSHNPETTVADLLDDPAQRDLAELTDAEILRRATREAAIAIVLISRAIKDRVTISECDPLELTPAIIALGRAIEVLPGAFDQALRLDAANQRSRRFTAPAPAS